MMHVSSKAESIIRFIDLLSDRKLISNYVNQLSKTMSAPSIYNPEAFSVYITVN